MDWLHAHETFKWTFDWKIEVSLDYYTSPRLRPLLHAWL